MPAVAIPVTFNITPQPDAEELTAREAALLTVKAITIDAPTEEARDYFLDIILHALEDCDDE